MAVARSSPKVAGQRSVVASDPKTEARIRQAGLAGKNDAAQGVVPKAAATGAEEAQKRRIRQGARKEAALDVLAPRRGDERE